MVGLGRMSVGRGWRRVEGPMGRWEGRWAWGVGGRGVVGRYDGSARVPGGMGGFGSHWGGGEGVEGWVGEWEEYVGGMDFKGRIWIRIGD